MVRVKSRCRNCFEVNLCLEDILLVEHEDDGDVYYTFICNNCGEAQAYAADRRFIDFMRMNGSQPILLKAPIEYKEAADNPALTWDDLLDLHLELKNYQED